MGPGFMGPPPHMRRNNDKYKEPLPKSIKEVPAYLKRLLGGFFSRLAYIVKLIWDTKKWILFVMTGTAIFDGVSPVISAYISAEILNELSDAYNLTTGGISFTDEMLAVVLWLFVAQIIYSVIQTAISGLSDMLSRIYGELVVNHIKTEIMEKSKRLDVKSFDDPEFYERFENASREAGMRPIQVLKATFNIFSAVISIVSFFIVLWVLSPAAPLIMLLLAVPSALINFIYRKKMVRYIRERSKDRRQLSYYSDLMTDKDMVKEVRILGLGDTFIDRYKEIFKRYFKGLEKIYIKEGLWNILLRFITMLAKTLLMFGIAYKVCRGELQIGDYSLYAGALASIASGVSTIVNETATVYEGTLFIDNLIRFMKEPITLISSVKEPLVPQRHVPHTIRFENVCFRYAGSTRNIIDHVNLELKSGEKVVLVGLNGAGKTTLIKLLTRLYDPTEGTIYFDGHDIKEYSTEELYKIFGIVFQDYGKYAVSVKDNISFGQIEKTVTDDEIVGAAVHSNANTFIEKLPKQYDTPLMRYFEDDGIELSIGQWQKLAVARAFYSDSDILILDEPTASLDAIAEQEIFDQFDSLRQGKLSIFVSHRLSSASTASKIVVLENGRVTEQGTHAELMNNKDGQYFKLFTTQAKHYVENTRPEDFEGFDMDMPDFPPRMPDGSMPFPPQMMDGKMPFPPQMKDGKMPFPPQMKDGKMPFPPQQTEN